MSTAEKKRILLVEDEPNLAFSLNFNLQAEGYEVLPATTGTAAIDMFEKAGPFDLILLDVMLPEMDGFEVARKIRSTDGKTGILMLTALSDNESKINGLEAGVDDYITKPFHLAELLLRVKRMLERADLFASSANTPAAANGAQFEAGPIVLNTESLFLKTETGEYQVTALECDILTEFLNNPGRVLSREHLLRQVWGVRGDVETRTVDNFIARLRKYLEPDPAKPQYLKSVRGRGYQLELS